MQDVLQGQRLEVVLIAAEEPDVHVGAQHSTRGELVADRHELTLVVAQGAIVGQVVDGLSAKSKQAD